MAAHRSTKHTVLDPCHPHYSRVEEDGITKTLFHWNARANRKLRFIQAAGAGASTSTTTGSKCECKFQFHPDSFFGRISLWSWEPHIITWYNLLIRIVANTLWVINGIYATWPEQAQSADRAAMISYVTGTVGAFMFIITGYLGFVEAINQTYAPVRVPPPLTVTTGTGTGTTITEPEPAKREFRRPQFSTYGEWKHPLRDSITMTGALENVRFQSLLAAGYPLVKDTETGLIVSDHWLKEEWYPHHGAVAVAVNIGKTNHSEHEHQEDIQRLLVGRTMEIIMMGFTLKVAVEQLELTSPQQQQQQQQQQASTKQNQNKDYAFRFRWWTWTPDVHEMAIFNALLFFVATILFFIPACAWWPMGNKGTASLASTIFWQYVLQIIPSIGFVYVGYACMAEASGSWEIKLGQLSHYSIGWWASLCNAIGGVGFLLYPILYLPAVVTPGCCGVLIKWGAAFATFWGSCFFWIAGILQWIEFCTPHPVILKK